MLILFMQPSALDAGPTPTQSSPLDQEADRATTGSRFKGGLPSLWSQVLEQPRPTGLLSLRPPESPLPTCGYTTTRGGGARACRAAAPSAGASGRPEQHRTPWRPAHLQRPPRGLPGTRKGAVARRSRSRSRKVERAPGTLPLLPGRSLSCCHESLQVRG